MKSPLENTVENWHIGPQYYRGGKNLFTVTSSDEKRWAHTGYQVAVGLDVDMKQHSQK